jgi:hypothetical protein
MTLTKAEWRRQWVLWNFSQRERKEGVSRYVRPDDWCPHVMRLRICPDGQCQGELTAFEQRRQVAVKQLPAQDSLCRHGLTYASCTDQWCQARAADAQNPAYQSGEFLVKTDELDAPLNDDLNERC